MEGKDRYRDMFEGMPQGIICLDSAGVISLVNFAAERILGLSRENILGKTYREAIWRDNRTETRPTEFFKLVKSVFDSGVILKNVLVSVWNARTNSRQWINVSVTPQTRPGENKPWQILLSLDDITEQTDASMAVEDALEIEKTFSRSLQRALVPDKLVLGQGYSLSDVYISKFESREIGGDFYDVFSTKDGKKGILLGDVSGKGLESVFLATSARSTVRAFAYETSSAGEAISRANDVLLSQIEEREEYGLFVTLVLAILDLTSGFMTLASAGHPPAAIYRSSRNIELSSHGDPPIGLFRGQQYTEEISSLDPGNKMVIYTDGLIEAKKGSEEFGIEGVKQVLETRGEMPCERLLIELLGDLYSWTSGKRNDDVAIVVIGREF